VHIVCLDLEGVLVPEIWIEFAELTGIDALRATTRDIPDYDELMGMRLGELHRHGLGLPDIERVVAELEPMKGAQAFLDGLRERHQVIILSDTFYEFAQPLMRRLGRPTLFCHRLEVAGDGAIRGYRLRLPDHKRAAVRAFRGLNFRTVAAGDSYNDTGMLGEADAGVFFRPPPNVIDDFPQFPVTATYPELAAAIGRGFGE